MIGPVYPRRSNSSRREIVCWNYRIFYTVSEKNKTVEILRIWHGAWGEPPFPI
ncbi:MAG: type II toxin-antitoxin system RelE/ParE family toxin [Limisphaerales bacterium]